MLFFQDTHLEILDKFLRRFKFRVIFGVRICQNRNDAFVCVHFFSGPRVWRPYWLCWRLHCRKLFLKKKRTLVTILISTTYLCKNPCLQNAARKMKNCAPTFVSYKEIFQIDFLTTADSKHAAKISVRPVNQLFTNLL